MSKHRPPTLEPRTGPPGTVVVALGSRAWISLGILAALGATILGLAAVGAASLGHPAFRALGFSLLGAGGATAALFRWKLWARERHDLDLGAVADLETARERLAQGDAAAASVAASRSATCARTPHTRNDALRTVAWAALEQGYPERAKAALDQTEPPYAVDLYCFAAVESARGALESAIAALEVARSAGSLTCEGAKLLVDCYLRRGGIDRAVVAAIQNRVVLGAGNCNAVVAAASRAGSDSAAAALASAIQSDLLPPPRALGGAHAG